MRYLKTLLVAMLAFVGTGAFAQSWTADEVGEGYFMLYNVGSGGDYWSSTPYDEDLACGLGFGSYGAAWGDSYFRFDEQSVRPVR